jgi:hypothetical protein
VRASRIRLDGTLIISPARKWSPSGVSTSWRFLGGWWIGCIQTTARLSRFHQSATYFFRMEIMSSWRKRSFRRRISCAHYVILLRAIYLVIFENHRSQWCPELLYIHFTKSNRVSIPHRLSYPRSGPCLCWGVGFFMSYFPGYFSVFC